MHSPVAGLILLFVTAGMFFGFAVALASLLNLRLNFDPTVGAAGILLLAGGAVFGAVWFAYLAVFDSYVKHKRRRARDRRSARFHKSSV